MTATCGIDTDELGALKQNFVTALRNAVGDHKRVAILDFPFHPNCGDSLIYLGELAALQEIGADILAVSDADGFRPQHYQSLPPDTVMLFHGGGNFGGLWDTPHIRRNEELEQLRTFKAVLLPQTMTTMDEECHQRTRAVLAQHSDVTLMWRDRKSFDAGRTFFPEASSLLVPDAAFCLHPLRAPAITLRSREHIALLARLDREGTGLADTVDTSVLVRDWECVFAEKVLRRFLSLAIKREQRFRGRPHMKWRTRLFYAYAHLNARSAARQLKSSDVVVLDRLHAWILSVLLGVPHVVVDTRYGKISGVITSWLPGELSTLATTPSDSLARAHELADVEHERRT
jgi:exopolysaccharide biosynthesis predicted pyruvyltransferase EpsI